MAKSYSSLFKNFTAQEKKDFSEVFTGKSGFSRVIKRPRYFFNLVVKLVRSIASRGKLVDDETASPFDASKPKQLPAGISPTTARGESRRVISLPMAESGKRRFQVDHPIVTGTEVKAESSNVYSYWYNYDAKTLFIRYWEVKREGSNSGSPQAGPTYSYSNVTPEEFLTLYKAGSKGTWVWDNLRIRGTVSGTKGGHAYDLVGVGDSGYVPRKATFSSGPSGPGEYFVQRNMNVPGTNIWLKSQRQNQLVSSYAKNTPNRGEPKRPRNGQ